MENKIQNYNETIFESIKHIDEFGNEYWSARELQKVLEYKKWENFEKVITKAKDACINSNMNVFEQLPEVGKLSKRANNTEVMIDDYHLSRYACYLIAQNGDSRKKVIALAQTYFAIQTRKQEIEEQRIEDEKRLMRRQDLTRVNKNLSGAAKVSGVRNYEKFINEGYKGLYNGETVTDIRNGKGLKKSHNISDYMGSEELGANIFRATQTEAKLKRDKIIGDTEASKIHYQIGKKVRNAIKNMGGTMPEDLPTTNKSIKEIEKLMIGDKNE